MSRTKSGARTRTASSSSHSRHAVGTVRANVQMIQNVLLVWLDAYIDENRNDCQNTISHLRRAVNAVNIFTDDSECIQFLDDMAKEKVCMIISGAFGQNIVPRLHDKSQIDSIFIFCSNKIHHEGWAKKWPKIKGVYTEIKPICNALKEAAQQCERNAVSISIMGTSETLSKKSLNQLDPCFIYTQIIKEILLTIDFEQQHFNQFIKHCRQALAGNPTELKYVDQLSREYHKETPIWWYTLECYLYKMLNRALRTMDADLMVKLGFFIADLHRQIHELHREEFGGSGSNQKFTVYRGQGMEKVDFEKMVASKGGLISFNCFLSTSKMRQVSQNFAERALSNPQQVGVLFVMTINPALSDTPFASVAQVGALGAGEDETLFSMNTVFRIGQIKQLGDHPRLFRVELNMTSEKDADLRLLMDRIREQTFPKSRGWYRLGSVLRKIGESAKAKQVYEVLLQQTTEESDRGPIYNQLGVMADELGEYNEAIEYYKKSIRIEEKQNPCNHQNLASCYNNIGVVYKSMGDYPKALSSYEKALAIRKQSLPPNHPDLASSYNNIGSVYDSIGDYPKALSSHEKALVIRKQSLPATHPDLAASYNNIGSVYQSMGDYPKALSSHEKALAIRKQSLPPTHPDLAMSHSNIGIAFEKMSEHSKALSSHEKALAIRQQSLPPTHPHLASSYNNIGLVYEKMGDYPKALSSHEMALAIKKRSLPPTHPSLANSYSNMGLLYERMKNYSKAHSCYERAVDIAARSFPPDHSVMQRHRNDFTRIKKRLQ